MQVANNTDNSKLVTSTSRKVSEEFIRSLYPESKKLIESLNIPSLETVRQTIASRADGFGLHDEHAAILLKALDTPVHSDVRTEIIESSKRLRYKLYENKVSLMIPIELSSFCTSNCNFCGWKSSNSDMPRFKISEKALLEQIDLAISQGISHIEIVAADDILLIRNDLTRIVDQVKKFVQQKSPHVRLSICLTPLPKSIYENLKELGADTVLTWQETYSEVAYFSEVKGGPKAHGLNQDLTIRNDFSGFMQRAMSYEDAIQAGMQVGMGVMLGLADVKADVLSVIKHAQILIREYDGSIHPIILGMPVLNKLTTDQNSKELSGFREEDFLLISAIYLLSLPDHKAWVFPNCRVSVTTQMRGIDVAGCFTSTSVRVGPGAYLNAKITEENYRQYFDRMKLPNKQFDNDTLLKGEQFEHHYHDHSFYVDEINRLGGAVCNDQWLLNRK